MGNEMRKKDKWRKNNNQQHQPIACLRSVAAAPDGMQPLHSGGCRKRKVEKRKSKNEKMQEEERGRRKRRRRKEKKEVARG